MNSDFDITIIGSGILSAKIALISAKQGLRVCVLSEKDFGDIGGFNKIDIVDKSNIIYENAANNFIPIDLINIDGKNSSFTKFYKQFSSKITKEKFKNSYNLAEIEPQFKNSNIEYATITKAYKYDYARVCIDTFLTAKEFGAKIYNYIDITNKNTNTINFKYLKNDYTINTKLIIDIRKKSLISTTNYFTIPRFKLELTNSMLINHNDYKIQITPYFSIIIIKLIGKISKTEALNKINLMFSKKIEEKEILDYWNTKNSDTEIEFNNNSALLYEQFSQKNTVALNNIFLWISKQLKIEIPAIFNIELHNNFTFEKQKTIIYEQVDKTFREVQQTNISPNEFTKLYYRYGSKFDIIIEKAYYFYNDKKNRQNAWLMAQIWYAKKYEMAQTTDDFIYRRANTYFSNYFDVNLQKLIKGYF